MSDYNDAFPGKHRKELDDFEQKRSMILELREEIKNTVTKFVEKYPALLSPTDFGENYSEIVKTMVLEQTLILNGDRKLQFPEQKREKKPKRKLKRVMGRP
jgi:hypothetical protein